MITLVHKYSEVKLLQVCDVTGNIADWKRLAESIDLVHDRNSKAKYNRRISRTTASIKTPTKKSSSPHTTQTSNRRERAISIDYKQLHQDGTFEEKRRKVDKFPPKLSGPSDSRIASQNLITSRKKSPVRVPVQKRCSDSPKNNQFSGYLPRRLVNVTQCSIKQELRSYEPTKPIKPEPGIFMRHRERPSDKDRQWKYVHVSGRKCRQGGAQDCNSQSENKDDDPTLPDLVTPRDCTVATGTLPDSLSCNADADAHLISPPAVERRLYMQNKPMDARERNLGDLLCTLNFDGLTPDSDMPQPIASSPVPIRSSTFTGVRKVVTEGPVVNASSVTTTGIRLPKTTEPRNVVTISSDDSTPPHITSIQSAQTLEPDTRSVVTPRSVSTDQVISVVDIDPNTTLASIPSTPQLPQPDTRSVVTPRPITTDQDTNVADIALNATLVSTSSTPQTVSRKETDAKDVNKDSSITQVSVSSTMTLPPPPPSTRPETTTPRSVVTNPDSTEMETANLLLQLSNSQSSLDSIGDNADILPVDAERMEDFTQEMREKEDAFEENATNNQQTNESNKAIDSDTDSNKTVNYATQQSPPASEMASPKGQLKYKHYSIARKSPSNAPVRNFYCSYCETTCHSKRDFNRHHKEEHTIVKCPDCVRTFPTPDALLRHRYVHSASHQFQCNICNKICGFKSDLDLHMLKHVEDKRWYCKADGCDKDFKRKSDLTSHEKVHLGEFFICEYPGCKYKNRDPRLVKRHQRVHTQDARVQCKKCIRKFVFYQQMKRHMKQDHKD